MAKTIKAVFGTSRRVRVAAQYQYDYNSELEFVGLELPQNFIVDLCNTKTGQAVQVTGVANKCTIPAQLFIPGTEIYAWVYLVDETSGHTEAEVCIPLHPRAVHTGDPPTPVQRAALDEAIAALNAATDAIPSAIDSALAEAKASGEFDGADGADGADGSGIWYVDVQYTNPTGARLRALVQNMIGRDGAAPAAGDLCVISDGRLCSVVMRMGTSALMDILSDISGEDGYSPTVTVTTIAGGHQVTITDADGDHVFNVMDGIGGGGSGATVFDFSIDADTHELLAWPDVDDVLAALPDAIARLNIYGENEAYYLHASFSDGTFSVVLGATEITVSPNGDEWAITEEYLSGGGTSDYTDLSNKPSINSVTLSGNKSLSDLGIAAASAVPAAATATPSDLGTAAVGSSAKFAREDHVHKKPTYSKSDVGLGNVDNVQQYSASNPPPYPVTSVNGATGAVSLSIPSSAGDVGAIPAPASPSAGDVLTYSSGAWAAAAPVHELPSGGNSGAVLAKSSATDYAVHWRTVSDYTAAGIITTAAVTAAKVCQYSFWDDTHYPQILYVTLASANTAASALTMKVNGKGPYPVYINGTASSSTNYTLQAGSYLVYFDGTNFYFQTDGKIPAAATDPQEVTISTAGAVSQALDAGKIYHFTGALTSLTITLNAAGTGILPQYHFDFDSGSTAPTVTLPGTVAMQGGSFMPEASKHYEVDILNGYGVSVAW